MRYSLFLHYSVPCDDHVSFRLLCLLQEKYLFASKGAILIEANRFGRPEWLEQGGIFIHHTTTANTLTQLRSLLGITFFSDKLPPHASSRVIAVLCSEWILCRRM